MREEMESRKKRKCVAMSRKREMSRKWKRVVMQLEVRMVTLKLRNHQYEYHKRRMELNTILFWK